MRWAFTIVVAVLVALAARSFAPWSATESAAPASGAAREVVQLRSALTALQAENTRLARELDGRESLVAAPAASDDGVADADIAAALARWRAAHPTEARAVAEGRTAKPPASADDVDFAQVPMSDLVALLKREGLTRIERQQIFQKLRDAGRIDEYVAAIEKLAAEDPKNADLQVALGNAYLQKLFGVGSGPEAGRWAMKSDQAFDRALELDDHNWAARFTKAVALANWPAFLGKGPIAIENFETLIEQQSHVPPRPEFAMTYYFLGNVYQANGDKDKALATWRAGLELFPDVQDLRTALDLAQGDGGGSGGR